MRNALPNRRAHDVIEFWFHGNDYTLGVGYTNGAVAEVFLDCRKITSEAACIARDAAVVLSIALQYGAPLDVLRKAITREEDGEASSVTGKVLDILMGEGR